MLISETKKFIFIHIFKTAGTSVNQVFAPYARLVDQLTHRWDFTSRAVGFCSQRIFDGTEAWLTGYHKHATVRDFHAKLGEEPYHDYYSFAFVRNPYDWIASLYYYIKGHPFHHMHEEANKRSFGEFIAYYLETAPPTQLDHLMAASGAVDVSRICRFENLEADVKEICAAVGIEFPGLPQSNVSALREKKEWRELYTAEMARSVHRYFQNDFVELKYESSLGAA